MAVANKFACTLLTLTLLAATISAGGFEITNVGPYGSGMGGAFRAVADDWTAAYYNPAGYANIMDNQIGGNWAFFHNRFEIDPRYRFGGTYESGVFNDRVNYNWHEFLNNPSAGFVTRLPLWGETVFGISAYQPFDYNIAWTMYDLPLAYNDSLFVPIDQWANNLDVVAFQLTVARQFMEEKLQIGLGLQLLRGDLLYREVVFRDNLYGSPVGDRPYDKIPTWSYHNGNGWGFGLRFGAMWHPTERLSVGLVAGLPFDLTIKGVMRDETYMPLNETLLNNNDSTGLQAGTPGHLFISGGRVVDEADFEVKLKLPPSIGGGVAYQVTDQLLVALDAEYTLWDRFDGLYFEYSDVRGLTGAADTSAEVREYLTPNLDRPVSWENSGKVMLGLRYDYNQFLTFVAGGSADQSPGRNAAEILPTFVDTGDKYSITGGLVVHIKQWDFGVVQRYTHYPEQNIGQQVDSNSDGVGDSFPGIYNAEYFETTFSFNYRF